MLKGWLTVPSSKHKGNSKPRYNGVLITAKAENRHARAGGNPFNLAYQKLSCDGTVWIPDWAGKTATYKADSIKTRLLWALPLWVAGELWGII